MADKRFAGQEARLDLINSSTQDPLLAEVHLVSLNWTSEIELVKRDFFGRTGPVYREFADGYSVEAELELNDAAQIVLFLNFIQGRGKGLQTDTIQLSCQYVNPFGEGFRVVFPETAFEPIALNLGGRKDFLKTTLKGKGETWKAQQL